DVKKIFEGDIVNGFKGINLVVANLNGLSVGAGTAWEIGYAYAKKIPIIGIKMDEPVEDAFDSLSAIIIESVEIVDSFDNLRERLSKFANQEFL
ncbi:MAG: nucleoside 2-deoxyribosyltransferase, partial [Nanoarchaeota archaeon]